MNFVFSRMLSPIGRNAQLCCAFYDVPLSDIAKVNKQFALFVLNKYLVLSASNKTNVIKKLRYVKYSIISLLVFDHNDIIFYYSVYVQSNLLLPFIFICVLCVRSIYL